VPSEVLEGTVAARTDAVLHPLELLLLARDVAFKTDPQMRIRIKPVKE
jgi:hypothetical protein